MADHIIRTEQDRRRLMAFLQGLDLSKPRKVSIAEIRSKRRQARGVAV